MIYLVVFCLVFSSALVIVVSISLILRLRDSVLLKVPFVPTSYRAVDQVVSSLALGETSSLCDLGCGDGRVLIAAAKQYPRATFNGYEKGVIPFLLAKIKTRKLTASILWGDFLQIDLTRFNRIYCYLSEDTLKQIEPKIIRECQQGTRIVTCDYEFPNLKSMQIIPLSSGSKIQRRLFVYHIK